MKVTRCSIAALLGLLWMMAALWCSPGIPDPTADPSSVEFRENLVRWSISRYRPFLNELVSAEIRTVDWKTGDFRVVPHDTRGNFFLEAKEGQRIVVSGDRWITPGSFRNQKIQLVDKRNNTLEDAEIAVQGRVAWLSQTYLVWIDSDGIQAIDTSGGQLRRLPTMQLDDLDSDKKWKPVDLSFRSDGCSILVEGEWKGPSNATSQTANKVFLFQISAGGLQCMNSWATAIGTRGRCLAKVTNAGVVSVAASGDRVEIRSVEDDSILSESSLDDELDFVANWARIDEVTGLLECPTSKGDGYWDPATGKQIIALPAHSLVQYWDRQKDRLAWIEHNRSFHLRETRTNNDVSKRFYMWGCSRVFQADEQTLLVCGSRSSNEVEAISIQDGTTIVHYRPWLAPVGIALFLAVSAFPVGWFWWQSAPTTRISWLFEAISVGIVSMMAIVLWLRQRDFSEASEASAFATLLLLSIINAFSSTMVVWTLFGTHNWMTKLSWNLIYTGIVAAVLYCSLDVIGFLLGGLTLFCSTSLFLFCSVWRWRGIEFRWPRERSTALVATEEPEKNVVSAKPISLQNLFWLTIAFAVVAAVARFFVLPVSVQQLFQQAMQIGTFLLGFACVGILLLWTSGWQILKTRSIGMCLAWTFIGPTIASLTAGIVAVCSSKGSTWSELLFLTLIMAIGFFAQSFLLAWLTLRAKACSLQAVTTISHAKTLSGFSFPKFTLG